MFQGVPRLFRVVPGCSGGVPGMFRGVPGCSGFYRHPSWTGISYAMKIVHDFISVREINIVRTVNPDWLESLDIRFTYVLFWSQKVTEAVKMHQK